MTRSRSAAAPAAAGSSAGVDGDDAVAFPSWWSQVWVQTRAQNRVFWRTPVAAFFTLFLPLIMMVLFNALFDGNVQTPDGELSVSQFYTAGLAAFTAVSATYTNLANLIPMRRDDGILKRVRGTPLPPSAYLAGVVSSALLVATAGSAFMLTLGVVVYDLEIEADKLPAAVVTFVVGIVAFSLLGLAIAGVIPSASSAPAAANATILPLAFISNVFIPLEDPPAWLEVTGDIFPLKPFVVAFQAAFNPFTEAPAFRWERLAVVGAWAVFGAVVALTKFNWEPSVRAGRTSRRKRSSAAGADRPA